MSLNPLEERELRQVRVLAVLFVLLSILAGISLNRDDNQLNPVSALNILEPFNDFSETTAVEMTIAGAKETVRLKRTGDLWFVTGEGYQYPADNGYVQSLVRDLSHISRSFLVTEAESEFSRYGVEDTATERIVIKDHNGNSRELVIGKPGADPGSVYFRVMGENKVFLSPSNLKTPFSRNESQWFDRQVFDFSPDEITRVKVSQGETVLLEADRSGAGWEIRSSVKEEIDSATVNSIVDRISALRAMEVLVNPPTLAKYDQGLAKPRFVVEFARRGTVDKIVVGNEKESSVFVRVTSKPAVTFRIAVHTIRNLTLQSQ